MCLKYVESKIIHYLLLILCLLQLLESLKPSKYYKPRHERDINTQSDNVDPQPATQEICDTDISVQEIQDSYINPIHSGNESCSENIEQDNRDSYLSPINRQVDTQRPVDTNGDIYTHAQLRGNINPGFSGEMTKNAPVPCLPSTNISPPSPPNINAEIDTDTV